MDDVRSSMAKQVSANESFVLNMIERFETSHPGASIVGLSIMPVDQRKIVKNKSDIISVRDEFIVRAKEMRIKNNGKTLALIEKRMISNR